MQGNYFLNINTNVALNVFKVNSINRKCNKTYVLNVRGNRK